MKNPLISIITVVYNGYSTLERAIQSVLGQDFADYEYIIIDGNSNDGSVDIIKRYSADLSYWISEPDNGIYDAMNKGLAAARGEWIYFLGADDILYQVLDKVAHLLTEKDHIYYGDVYRPYARRRYDGEFSPLKLSFRNICHQSIFYHRNVFSKYSYNLNYPLFADYELNIKCYCDKSFVFNYIPIVVAEFNDKGGLSNTNIDNNFEKNKIKIISKYFPFYIFLISSIGHTIINLLILLKLDRYLIEFRNFIFRSR